MAVKIMIDREAALHQMDLGIKVAQDNSWAEAHKLLEGVKKFLVDLDQFIVEVNEENKSGKEVIEENK